MALKNSFPFFLREKKEQYAFSGISTFSRVNWDRSSGLWYYWAWLLLVQMSPTRAGLYANLGAFNVLFECPALALWQSIELTLQSRSDELFYLCSPNSGNIPKRSNSFLSLIYIQHTASNDTHFNSILLSFLFSIMSSSMSKVNWVPICFNILLFVPD